MAENERESVFDSVESALRQVAAGGLVVVADDEDRENEGDLVMAAVKATPETVNMMIRHGRGLICVTAPGDHLKKLGLGPMVPENRESHHTDFAISVDAAQGVSTGISACDRARTIRVLANPEARPEELVSPGHVFPLRAKPGGVLERAGHTEASVDLAMLAGLSPVGVLCEILNEDGSLARLSDLLAFKRRFQLPMISIADLIEFRHKREKLVEATASHPFACPFGHFHLTVFQSRIDGRHHLAFTMGRLETSPVLVRVQSENVLSDVFQGNAWSNHRTLISSLRMVAREGRGAVLYIGQADAGLPGGLRALSGRSDSEGVSSISDFRNYGIGAQILAALGVKKIRLITSQPRNVVALDGYDLEIVEHVNPSD